MTTAKKNPGTLAGVRGAGKQRRWNSPKYTGNTKNHQRRSINFDAVNRAALAVLPLVCLRLFPAGKVEGAEFCIGSLRGEPGRSLKVNLRKGCWRDFSAGVGGSDPVSLVATVEGVGMGEAARLLGRMVGVDHA